MVGQAIEQHNLTIGHMTGQSNHHATSYACYVSYCDKEGCSIKAVLKKGVHCLACLVDVAEEADLDLGG